MLGNHRMVTVIEGVVVAGAVAAPVSLIGGGLVSFAYQLGEQLGQWRGVVFGGAGLWALCFAGSATYLVGEVIKLRNGKPSGVTYQVKVNEGIPELDTYDQPMRRYHTEMSIVAKRRVLRNAVTPALPEFIPIDDMKWFAAQVVVNGTPINHENFANGALRRSRWDALRDYMIDNGLLTGRGRGAKTRITDQGEIWLRQIHERVGSPPPGYKPGVN